MLSYLLLDFGATRVKSALCNLDDGSFSNIISHESLKNCSPQKDFYEISLHDLKNQFISICRDYQKKSKFNGIVLCSQMHGFILLNEKDEPITEYISWRDERSLNKIKGKDSFSLLNECLENKFREITGMKPRPGLPVFNIAHLGRQKYIKKTVKVIAIPEWLSMIGGRQTNKVHPTMLAGSGFYDVNKKQVSKKIVDMIESLSGVKCTFNETASEGVISGYFDGIPVYTGIGDHQCALLGACNEPQKSISINIGTGSQVSVIDGYINNKTVDLRPYLGQSLLSTITHIPSGRILAVYIDFLKTISKEIDFWKKLSLLKYTEILKSDLIFDMGLFKSAWNYAGGGLIKNITEKNLTLDNYLASLLKSFLMQYLEAIKIIDPLNKYKCCIVSGGIPNKLSNIIQVIAKLSKRKTLQATEIDETFIGLRTLALISEFKINYKKAQSIFKRRVIVK